MNNPRISIIIPCFNEERYLAACLESIASQTLKPHEVIVVDNNSTDCSAGVAQRYKFARLLHESQQGRVFAQAAGFSAATGEVLARIDADTVLPIDWAQRLTSYFETPESRQTAWTAGALFYNVSLPHLVSALYGWVAFTCNRLLTGQPSLWGSSMALPRALWQEVAGEIIMRADVHEDLDLSIHLQKRGYTIFYDSQNRVGVELRPAYAGAREVWRYLKMWPRTLKLNGIRTWPLCWPINLLIFAGMPFFGLSARLAHLFGRSPI